MSPLTPVLTLGISFVRMVQTVGLMVTSPGYGQAVTSVTALEFRGVLTPDVPYTTSVLI